MGAGISSTGVTESGTCDCTAGTPELGDPTLYLGAFDPGSGQN